jgi:hypothetical protein
MKTVLAVDLWISPEKNAPYFPAIASGEFKMFLKPDLVGSIILKLLALRVALDKP